MYLFHAMGPNAGQRIDEPDEFTPNGVQELDGEHGFLQECGRRATT